MVSFESLKTVPRLLLESQLKPLQGDRFQATGFPDLGPACYTSPEGVSMLLLESAQSVANRMELACCNEEDNKSLIKPLEGLPYVRSIDNDKKNITTSFLEAHRLSSPYLLNETWAKQLSSEMDLQPNFQLNNSKIYKAIFKYDPACLLHGIWFSLYKQFFSGGRVRLTRALSGFIEAKEVKEVESGGTKFDKNRASSEDFSGSSETGYGTLPFHRREFEAKYIIAYFNLDLSLLRSYKLGEVATDLLIALALFKIRRFLSTGLRLRSACDLQQKDTKLISSTGFIVPEEKELLETISQKMKDCKNQKLFADPSITEILWNPPAPKEDKKSKKKKSEEELLEDETDTSEMGV